ncbi:MAG: hypothetical protein M1491_05770 [Deltaproteobacteria bacterium]|nr:hypothetical protein [Deltaproteobacteria bacterium]
MITGNISTGLIKDLLAFESEKYNLPFVVSVEDLNDYEDSIAIRKAVEVYIHTGTGITKELTFKDNQIVLTNVHLPYGTNPSDDGIYGVLNSKVFIGFDIETYSSEPWINALFASIFDKIMPGIKQYMDNEADKKWQEEYLKLKQYTRKQQVRTMKSDIDSNADEIETKTNEIKEFIAKNYTLAQAIQSITSTPEGVMRRSTLSEFESLMQLTPEPISHIELDTSEGKISVYTNEIYIDYEENDYYIGKFKITIEPASSTIKLTNTVKKVKGYHHPHISQDGTPCLGNIASTVYYLLIHQDIYQLVTLLIEFLRSYNEQNPYAKIEFWDPEYDEEEDGMDQYSSCYQDSGPYDCVICSDSSCPFHDDAQDRCRETRENPDDCVECMAQCQYARNYEQCFEHQRQSRTAECRSCQISDCPHNRQTRQRA